MIYSKDFVWLHFPKCAGTKVAQIFRKYFASDTTIIQDPTDIVIDPENCWHDSISMRTERDSSFQLGDRAVICSFRRLPSWLISRYSYEVNRSPTLDHKPELLLEGKFLEKSGMLNSADFYCQKYLPPEILNSSRVRFLRTECFEHDFKEIFGQFFDVSQIPKFVFDERVNSTPETVTWKVKWKLRLMSKMLYEHCPYWKEIEQLAY